MRGHCQTEYIVVLCSVVCVVCFVVLRCVVCSVVSVVLRSVLLGKVTSCHKAKYVLGMKQI
jgi:hypothetical protein